MTWKTLMICGVLLFSTPLLAVGQKPIPVKLSNGISYNYTTIDGTYAPGLPKEYEHFYWHLFRTDNFEVLSIDRDQGIMIANRCEELRMWGYERWGLPSSSYDRTCMIMCAPNESVFYNWFRRRNIDPKITQAKKMDGTDREVYAVWTDGGKGNRRFLTNKLPEKIGRVNLLNYESIHQTKLPYWAHVGMSSLNNDIPFIRNLLSSLDANDEYRLDMVLKDNSFGDDSYQAKATAFCLMLRRSGSSEDYVKLLFDKNEITQLLAKLYGFSGERHFNETYTRYVRNLSYDLHHGQTPNMGLTWFTPKKIKY